jgi:hypothetical protein
MSYLLSQSYIISSYYRTVSFEEYRRSIVQALSRSNPHVEVPRFELTIRKLTAKNKNDEKRSTT